MSRYAAIHNVDTCRKEVFYYPTNIGTKTFRAEKAVLFNGKRPIKGRPIICEHCGQVVHTSELVMVYQEQDLPLCHTIIMVDNPMSMAQRLYLDDDKAKEALREWLEQKGLRINTQDVSQLLQQLQGT